MQCGEIAWVFIAYRRAKHMTWDGTDDNKKSIGKNADLEPGVPAILANLLYQF